MGGSEVTYEALLKDAESFEQSLRVNVETKLWSLAKQILKDSGWPAIAIQYGIPGFRDGDPTTPEIQIFPSSHNYCDIQTWEKSNNGYGTKCRTLFHGDTGEIVFNDPVHGELEVDSDLNPWCTSPEQKLAAQAFETLGHVYLKLKMPQDSFAVIFYLNDQQDLEVLIPSRVTYE